MGVTERTSGLAEKIYEELKGGKKGLWWDFSIS